MRKNTCSNILNCLIGHPLITCGYFRLFLFAVRKCETQSSVPHPGCTSHTLESTPPLRDAHAPSGDISPAQKSVTCASHKPLNNMASENGCHISEENFVGILHTTHNSSFLSDSLLSVDCSSSSFDSTNDLSRQTSLYSEPQLSYRNIP